MSFLEYRFPLVVSHDSDGGAEYSTEVIEIYSGYEQRNERWSEPKYRFNVATGVKTTTDLYTLITFFHAVGGRAHGFRYKDWSDYKSCGPLATLANNDQIIVAAATAGQSTAQLAKTYTYGSLSRTRYISKPVSGTTVLAKNGVAFTSGWTIDTTTGIITFATPLTLNDVVTAGFEFDVPVRFDTDKISTKFVYYKLGEIEVPVVGIRV